MNVEAGDRARIVKTGTLNDGAIVDVVALDQEWSATQQKPIWFVRGVKLLGFNSRVPNAVLEGGLIPDRNLRKLPPGHPALDTRMQTNEPTDALAAAVRKTLETACPTT